MCIDGNSATLSVRYLNAQLGALWENAVDCAAHSSYTDFKSSEFDKGKYTRALREFHLLTKRPAKALSEEELLFHAVFGKPTIKFICNHEAVLFFKIERGHLNLAHESFATAGFRADRLKNRKLKGLELAFRVSFLRTNVKGRDDKIGNASAKHLVQMIALQMDTAKLIMIGPDKSVSADVESALAFYMKKYLAFLVSSGNHVLFDLSDFDDNKTRPEIDYALIHTVETERLVESQSHDIQLLGVDMALVSTFYRLQWLVASGIRDQQHWGSLELCLAAICSDWVVGSQVSSHFFIDFDVPTIKPLCKHEAIITFHVKNLAFFAEGSISSSSRPIKEFRGWEIAFIVNVFKPESAGLLQLDLDTARFSRHFSSFGGETKDTIVQLYISQMIKFFSIDYLDIISRYELHIVMNAPPKPELRNDYSEDWSSTDEEEIDRPKRQKGHAMLWTERIRGTFMFGYDQIISLSEESINTVLSKRRQVACYWFHKSLANFNVSALSLRLLTNGKAIVYVEVDGWMAVKKSTRDTKYWVPHDTMLPSEYDETEAYQFDSITVAYEVDLRMIAHTHVKTQLHSKAWDYLCGVWNVVEHFDVKHLTLDLNTASYINDLSDVTALGADTYSLTRLNIIKAYIPQYFSELVAHGHHILHTVPMNLNSGALTLGANAGLDIFAFSQVAFRVITKRNITVKTCTCEGAVAGESPYVMIYGVCPGREMPILEIPWCPGWLPTGKSAVGTIGFSRRIALDHCILRHLKEVNAHTTILPSEADVVDGVWHIKLTTWAEHALRKGSRIGCQWQEVSSGSDNYLAFEWKYRDEWKHEHEGNSADDANREYRLSCVTHNTVRVPTHFDDRTRTLDIIVSGTSVVSVSGKDSQYKWGKESRSTWSASVKVQTQSGKLKVSVSCRHDPIAPAGSQPSVETCPFDVVGMHEHQIQKRLDALEDTLVESLRSTLEGSWAYSALGYQTMDLHEPVFTRKGDLICELDFYDSASASLYATAWSNIVGEAPALPRPALSPPQFKLNSNGNANGNGNGTYANGNGNGNGNGTYDDSQYFQPAYNAEARASSVKLPEVSTPDQSLGPEDSSSEVGSQSGRGEEEDE